MSRLLTALAAALLLGLVGLGNAAKADVICQETDAGGCGGVIPASSPPLSVYSDGEAYFDPLGAGYDTSDAIALNSNWVQQTGSIWTQLPGTSNWVLPADLSGIGCGIENATTCEPVGAWYFPGAQWAAGTPAVDTLLESDGSISDVILVNNFGPGGSAQILFYSDPSFPVPEPASLLVLSAALAGLAAARRRRI